MKELFELSDVISIHVPLLPETEGLISGPLMRSMKSGGTLINTSRGAVIDEQALYQVFAERSDLTAVLDVTYPEPPLPDSPLFDLENVILTPHIAGSMSGEVSRMGRWMADDLLRWIDGCPLQHQVTREMIARLA